MYFNMFTRKTICGYEPKEFKILMHISVPGSKSVPFKIAYWDVYLEKEILKAMQCVLWLYENQGWQKFQFEIWGAIGRHMGSTALFQSPL